MLLALDFPVLDISDHWTHVDFCVWLLSEAQSFQCLSTVYRVSGPSSFSCWIVLHCEGRHCLLTHSSTGEYLGCLHFLTIVTIVYEFLLEHLLPAFLGTYHGVELEHPVLILCLNYYWGTSRLLSKVYTSWHSSHHEWKFLFVCNFVNICCFPWFHYFFLSPYGHSTECEVVSHCGFGVFH